MKYNLFTGNYERVFGRAVYHKLKNEYIPCEVTNYYFKSRKYALVPIEDVRRYLGEQHQKRRVFYTTKVYLPVDGGQTGRVAGAYG